MFVPVVVIKHVLLPIHADSLPFPEEIDPLTTTDSRMQVTQILGKYFAVDRLFSFSAMRTQVKIQLPSVCCKQKSEGQVS